MEAPIDAAPSPSPKAGHFTPAIGRTASGVAKIFYTAAALGALAGGFELYVGMNMATSAPQQAASAAMACSYAILPYVLARAVDELSR